FLLISSVFLFMCLLYSPHLLFYEYDANSIKNTKKKWSNFPISTQTFQYSFDLWLLFLTLILVLEKSQFHLPLPFVFFLEKTAYLILIFLFLLIDTSLL